jgi:putative hydrolase of the HAD superfamily
MPRAILIDLYDTLVASDWHLWRDLLARHVGMEPATLGRAFDETRPDRSVGAFATEEDDTRAVLEAAGLTHDAGHVRELVRIERDFMTTGVRLYGDSLPTVRALRAEGVKTVLVSNCSHNTRPVVARLDLKREFDALILSLEVGARKPQRAIYQAALDAIGSQAAEAIFVDDQADYCDGARALGIDTRLIIRPDAHPPEGFASSTNGHPVITDLTALLRST